MGWTLLSWMNITCIWNLCITGFLFSCGWGHPVPDTHNDCYSATLWSNWNVETLSVVWKFTNTSFFCNPCTGRLSALHTGCLYPHGDIPCTHCCYRLSWFQAHIVAGRIMSKKYSNNTVENQTHDLPACSSVPQPTMPPSATTNTHYTIYICQHSLW